MGGPGLSLHRRAQRFTRRIGAAITFTHVARTISPTTGATTATTSTTVSGYAIQLQDDFEEYQALGLVHERTMTLQFSPNTAGDRPEEGATATWNGELVTVQKVKVLGPDGSGIIYRVFVGR